MQIALTMVCVWPSELPVIGRLETILMVSAPLLPTFTPLQFAPPPPAVVAPAPERPLHPATISRSAAVTAGAARHDERIMLGYLSLARCKLRSRAGGSGRIAPEKSEAGSASGRATLLAARRPTTGRVVSRV